MISSVDRSRLRGAPSLAEAEQPASAGGSDFPAKRLNRLLLLPLGLSGVPGPLTP